MSKGAKLIFQLLADLECMRTFAFAIVRLCEGWGMRLGVGWVTLTFGIVCVQSILRWNTSTAIRNFLYNDNVPMTVMLMLSCFLKGKSGDLFLLAQSFYRPQTKTCFKRQFAPKSPKVGKNQAKGSKIHKIRTKGIQAAVVIHQFCPPSYCGNPLYIQHTFSSTMSNAFMIFIWSNLQRWKYQLTQNFIFICKCSTWIIKAFDIVEEKVCWIYSGFPQ